MKREELIQKYLSETINSDELEVLQNALEKDEAFLREFLLDTHLENAIENHFKPDGKKSIMPITTEDYDGEISEEELGDIAAAGNPMTPEDPNNDQNN